MLDLESFISTLFKASRLMIVTNDTELSNMFSKIIMDKLVEKHEKLDYQCNVYLDDNYLNLDMFIKRHIRNDADKSLVCYRRIDSLRYKDVINKLKQYILYYPVKGLCSVRLYNQVVGLGVPINNSNLFYIIDDIIYDGFEHPYDLNKIFREEILARKIEKLKKKLYI